MYLFSFSDFVGFLDWEINAFDSHHNSENCSTRECSAESFLTEELDYSFPQFGWQVMTDPDAPSPSEPSMREWVHW